MLLGTLLLATKSDSLNFFSKISLAFLSISKIFEIGVARFKLLMFDLFWPPVQSLL